MSQTRSKHFLKGYSGGAIVSFPEADQITGTASITAGQKVVACASTSTDFDEVKAGDFLFLKTTQKAEIVEITGVDGTKIHLKFPATNTHSGVDILVIKSEQGVQHKHKVSVILDPAEDGLVINGNAVDLSGYTLFGNKLTFDLVEPIAVEANMDFIITNGY